MYFTVEDLKSRAIQDNDLDMTVWFEHLIATFGDVGGLAEHLDLEQQQADIAAERAETFLKIYLLQTAGMTMGWNGKSKRGVEKFVELAAWAKQKEVDNENYSLYDLSRELLDMVLAKQHKGKGKK